MKFFLSLFLFINLISRATICVASSDHLPLHLQNPPLFNITASNQHQFIWFRVAKVGTRTILDILEKHSELTISGYSVPFEAKKSKNYFKFAFVRNPWDRVVSCYHKQVVTKINPHYHACWDKDFDFFIDFIASQNLTRCDVHIKQQTALIPLKDVDFIGRFENFEEDLRYVLAAIGLSHAEIAHKNKSEHKHYSEYYTKRTQDIIYKKYRKDIKTFGYQFERLK